MAQPTNPSSARPVVLVVEDAQEVRTTLCRILEHRGFATIPAADGRTALELAAEHRIDVMVTDIVMPGMTGRELGEQLARIQPDAKIVYVSGYPHDVVRRIMDVDRELGYLPKPFTPDQLIRRVREAIGSA